MAATEISDVAYKLQLIASAVSFCIVALTIYNVYFHPLRPFPGSKLAASSGVVLISCLLHSYSRELSQRGLDSIWIKTLLGALGLFFSGAILLFTRQIIYNIYFHPLRNFPGPKLAAASRFYMLVYQFLGIKHLLEERLHHKYGEVVRIGPETLSFTNEVAWQDIYGNRPGKGQLPKRLRNFKIEGAYSIMNAPDAEHARQRRALSHAFSEKALREQEPLIQGYIAQLISHLREDAQAGKVVNLVDYFNFLTFDLISDLAFGTPFGALRSRTVHPWMKTFFKSFKEAAMMGLLAFVPILTPLLVLFGGPMRQAQIERFAFTKRKVAERLERKSDRADFMSAVLKNSEGEGKGLTRAELDIAFNVLLVAGSETTATALSGCLYLLRRHPDDLCKVQKELDDAFASSNDITLTRVNSLPYLFAVIQEALRIYPPIPVALGRQTPPEGATIAGHWVPGRFGVGVPQRAANLSPTNFTHPKEFLPERFLPNQEAQFSRDRKAAFQPFSFGPRNCLGKNLALAEIKLALAHFLYTFDFELVDQSHDWLDQKTYTVWQKKPLILKVKERNDSS